MVGLFLQTALEEGMYCRPLERPMDEGHWRGTSLIPNAGLPLALLMIDDHIFSSPHLSRGDILGNAPHDTVLKTRLLNSS